MTSSKLTWLLRRFDRDHAELNAVAMVFVLENSPAEHYSRMNDCTDCDRELVANFSAPSRTARTIEKAESLVALTCSQTVKHPRYHSSTVGQNSFPWLSDIAVAGRFALHAACWRRLWRCCLAASSLRSRSAWISC